MSGQQQGQQVHFQEMEGGNAPPPQSQQQNQQEQPPPPPPPPPQQQAPPVNFGNSGSYPSRRVTIGGSQNQAGDRRGSLGFGGGASGGMDDFFGGRRGSIGFDMGVEAFLGRRDSMDSTTALDQAILDLTRRRYSMATGMGPGDMGPPPGQPDLRNIGGMASLGGTIAGGMSGMGGMDMNPPPQPPPYSPGPAGGSVDSIATRQQQLQQQQRELEQRQKELELQRQQLIASMSDRSYMMHGHPPMMRGPGGYGGSLGLGGSGHAGSLGLGPGSGSLGLGSFQGPGSFVDVSQRGGSLDVSQRSSNASSSSQWWICQVCNSKAFASHEEAMQHEAICPDGRMKQLDPMNPISLRDMYPGRNYSMGMDSSARSATYESSNVSSGPFASMESPISLAMPSDKDWLTPLHCFVRQQCVEVFTASPNDVTNPSKGKRKPITIGQVGIRCPHCHKDPPSDSSQKASRERGSVYYPTTISSIYNATMNLLQRHLHTCSSVPDDIMRRYETLKADDARSGTSKRYWIESALSLGLVDTAMGIRYLARRPPPLPSLHPQEAEGAGEHNRHNSHDYFSSNSNALADMKEGGHKGADENVAGSDAVLRPEQETVQPLVSPEDKSYSTAFSYHLLSQMQPCVFTEADRLGKRKGLPPGFPGLACRHCFGGYGSGRFFPSSIKTLSDTSKTLNVLHNHMMRCRKCPAEVREALEKLRGTHDEERAKMKFGSQKAFFARIWERLHGKDAPRAMKRKAAPTAQSHASAFKPPTQASGHVPPVHEPSSVQEHMTRPPQTGLDALVEASDPKRQKV